MSDYNRKYHNRSTLNGKLYRRNRLQNGITHHESDSTYETRCTHCQDENKTDRYHLQLYKHRIDMLTAALDNFRIQNERLKQELTKYHGRTADSEAFRLRNHIKQMTVQTQNQSLAWKVRALEKTIARMKKSNVIIEHVYRKKLQRITRVKSENLLS